MRPTSRAWRATSDWRGPTVWAVAPGVLGSGGTITRWSDAERDQAQALVGRAVLEHPV